jgi:hypothetical protein
VNAQKILYGLLLIISVATVISGIVQMLVPSFILGLIGAEISPTTEQCFGIVGMFMTLFGGMLFQVLLARQLVQPVFLWAGLQKICAWAAVTIGVCRHIFSPLALAIACFDLLSGILILVYMKLARQNGSPS